MGDPLCDLRSPESLDFNPANKIICGIRNNFVRVRIVVLVFSGGAIGRKCV